MNLFAAVLIALIGHGAGETQSRLFSVAPCLCGQSAPEERVDDVDYEKVVAVHVKAVQAIEKAWRKDPAESLKSIDAALKAMESDLAPRFPRLIEATIAVRVTRGIDKGEVKDRIAFFPYRLAGEIALTAGEPGRAVDWLQKSPTSAALLAEAKKAVAAKDKKDPPLPPPPPKPGVDLKPFLEKHDFVGALDALRTKGTPGAETDRLAADVRRDAAAHQRSAIATLAGVLPRLDQPGFRKDHLEPCLRSCDKVPRDVQSAEFHWVSQLDRWFEKRDPAEFERLAVDGARFGADFTVLCDRAQDDRLKEIDRLVHAVIQADRGERAKLLDQLGQSERAFAALFAAHERTDARDRLTSLKGKLPIDDQALDSARTRPWTIAEIRRLSDDLERLWTSERRARLSVPDQKDLALYLGLYRCMALLLEGKSIPEAAEDLRLREVFRVAGELPAGVSPKVAAVRARITK